MDCCQTEGIEELMDEKVAARDLKRYRRKGPSRTTRMLMNNLEQQGISNTKLLDIGGGVGAIQHGLLKAGVAFAISVDASSAYLISRVLVWMQNQYFRIRGSQFRAFVHSTSAVEGVIQGTGLNRIFKGRTLMWQVYIYRRL
jgi:hypothetical protein